MDINATRQDQKGGTDQYSVQCFGFADERDTSCALRCALRKACLQRRSEALPVCYGTYREGIIECTLCINASMCIDTKEKIEGKMPKIQLKRKAAPVPVAPPVEEEEIEAEEEAEAEAIEVAEAEAEEEVEAIEITEEDIKQHDYYSLEIPDLRVECQSRGLNYTGSKMQLCKRLIEHDLTAEMPAPVAAPVIKQIVKPAVRPAVAKQVVKPATVVTKTVVSGKPVVKQVVKQVLKPAAAVVAKPVVAAKPAASKQTAQLEIDFWTRALDHLDEGKSIFITRIAGTGTDPASFSLRISDGDVSGKKAGRLPRGSTKAFEDVVFSEEFKTYAFVDSGTGFANEDGTPKGWIQLTRDEKRQFAEANTIEWEHSDSEQMDMIRMSEAVRTALGIEKYKPEYATRAARDGLKVEMGIK